MQVGKVGVHPPRSPGIPSTPESRGGRATAGGGCRRAVRWGSRPGAWRPGRPGPQPAARETRRRTRPWPQGRAQDSVPACPVPELTLQPLHSFQLRVRHAGDSTRWGSVVEEATGSGLQPQIAVCRKVGGQGEDCEPGAGETAPKHARMRAFSWARAHTQSRTHTQSPTHTHSHTHTYTHSLTHTLTLTHTHIHTLTCTLIHIYTHSYMHTLTHIHTHTHTSSRSCCAEGP